MIKRLYLIMILLFVVGLNQTVIAAGLKQPMQELNVAYKAFNEAQNNQDASKALTAMYNATLVSKKHLPSQLAQLRADDEQIKVYRLMLDMLLVDIDEAKKLVDANRLLDAKKNLGKIDAIKNQGHQKFK